MLFSAVQAHHLHLAKICHGEKMFWTKNILCSRWGRSLKNSVFLDILGYFCIKMENTLFEFKGNIAFFFFFFIGQNRNAYQYLSEQKAISSSHWPTPEFWNLCRAELLPWESQQLLPLSISGYLRWEFLQCVASGHGLSPAWGTWAGSRPDLGRLGFCAA